MRTGFRYAPLIAIVAPLLCMAAPAEANSRFLTRAAYGTGHPAGFTPILPTLGALTISPTTATAGQPYSGTIAGLTSGSTVTATSSDGTVLSATGGTLGGTFSASGTPTVSLTETLAGATNSPRTSTATITVAAAPTGLLMGSRQSLGGNEAKSNGTNTNSNARLAFWNETGASVSKLKAYFVGWNISLASGELAVGNDVPFSASIEYPAGTLTALTCSSASSCTVTNGATLASDEATLTTAIPAGAQFWIRTNVAVTSGQKWPTQYSPITGYGDAVDVDTGTSKVAGGTITNTGQVAFGPVAIKATAFSSGTPVTKAFALFGDSIFFGQSLSKYDTHANTGYFAHAMTGRYPVANYSLGSTAAYSNQGNFARRAALLAQIGATDAVNNFGVNDLRGTVPASSPAAGYTASQILANLGTIWQLEQQQGVRVSQTTITPDTCSTDHWLSAGSQTPAPGPCDPTVLANQFTGGASSTRAQLNVALRAKPSPLYKVVDVASAVEVDSTGAASTNAGLWITKDQNSTYFPAGLSFTVGTGATTTSVPTNLNVASAAPYVLGEIVWLTGALAGKASGVTTVTTGANGTLTLPATSANNTQPSSAPVAGDTGVLYKYGAWATVDGLHPLAPDSAFTIGGQVLLRDYVISQLGAW